MHVIESKEMQEGDGVTVRRMFPFYRDRLVLDPFVLWDDFEIGPGAGFPTHAHRGFEAITYLFEGAMNHADNLGNNSTVTSGGAQRFTAGHGIQHSEMPGENGPTRGIQLWINLPKSLKQVDPEYQQVDRENIPEITQPGVLIRQIVGDDSPLQLRTTVRFEELQIQGGSEYELNVDEDLQGMIYLHQGKVSINGQHIDEGQAMQVAAGEQVKIVSDADSQLMLVLGKPHLETVRLTGGFVD